MSINNLLTPTSGTNLRSYRHATRIFVDDNYRLSPKYGFLFYVEFDFNPLITNVSNNAAQELGMIVKSAQMPKYTIETKIHNAYNRKNISQQKISYDPITISFHDDQADNVRNFWYDYYSFFFRDSDYADATYQGIHKYQSRPTFDWGYSPRPTVGYNSSNANQPYQYIQAIRIYSMYQKNFSECELINPIINSFKHGDHAHAGNDGVLDMTMSVQYEAVKYYTGYVVNDNVGGFLELHYDNVKSPIAPAQGTDLVDNGTGGYANASDTITDLAGVNPLYGINQSTTALNFGATGLGLSGILGSTTRLVGAAGVNLGGFSIPNLGSLTAGLTNGAVLGQQLQAAGAALAGSAVSTLANGVIGGIANGLGPQATSLIGLAAAVIANPSAALRTVQNMAINYATGLAQQLAAKAAGSISNYISTTIQNAYQGSALQTIVNDVVALPGKFATAIGDAINNAGYAIEAQLISVPEFDLGTIVP
jgi:hypothetical protein